jgi:hypothetical protein
MEFIEPCKDGLTVYSKSDCRNCDYVKALLYRSEYKKVNCDKYLEDDKEAFKSFMFHHMGFIPADNRLYFPVVFYQGKYLKNPQKQIYDYIGYN